MPDLIGVYGFTATDESRPYIVGPAVEIGLPRNLALEFDALYQREGFTDGLFDSDTGVLRLWPGTGEFLAVSGSGEIQHSASNDQTGCLGGLFTAYSERNCG